jgi:hypothetical protein
VRCPRDEVKGTTFKHRIVEVHATSLKRLSKVEADDDPTDGADDERSSAWEDEAMKLRPPNVFPPLRIALLPDGRPTTRPTAVEPALAGTAVLLTTR